MASIRKRTLPSGKTAWQCDYLDQRGKRRSKQFQTKREATDWLTNAAYQVRHGMHTPSDSITVKDAGELWIAAAEIERGRRPSTIKQYREHLNVHICDEDVGIGNVKLSDLTTARCKQFYQDLVTHKSRPMAGKVLTSLKSILNEAQIQGQVAVNVALPVKPPRETSIRRAAQIPPRESIVSILESSPARYRALLHTATLGGLRAGELRALAWPDVDFKAAQIDVNKSADYLRNINPPKSSAGYRKVPMSALVVKTLKEWKIGCKPTVAKLVFPNTAGEVMHQNDINQNLWPDLIEKAELLREGKPAFRFHDLRHVAASLFIDAGANPKRLMAIMGHSSIKVTFDLYGHLWEDLEADQSLAARAEQSLFA